MKQEVMDAQAIVNQSKCNGFNFRHFYRQSILLCDHILIDKDTLKNLTIAEIKRHHDFLTGKKDRCVNNAHSKKLGQNSTSRDDGLFDLRSPLLSSIESDSLNPSDISISVIPPCKKSRQVSSPLADTIINSCDEDLDNWDAELASDNLLNICRRISR
jgi:hypothetical protein